MTILYVADDGKQFDNEDDCLHYEWTNLKHPSLKDVKMYDGNGKLLEDIFSEDTYGCCMEIIVPTDKAAEDMKALAKYTGHCYYAHITESGVWKYNDDEHCFELLQKEIE